MSYLGNTVTSTPFIVDVFSGTGAQLAFTGLTFAPAGTAAIAVFVGGSYQSPTSYSVSGTTLTFNSAPAAGTSNIQVLHLGVGATAGVPSDGSVTTVKIANGAITADKIADGTIVAADIADGSVTGPKIGLTAINANNIVNGTITNDKLATPGATTGKAIAMSIVFGG